MAGGGFVSAGGQKQYPGKMTDYVFFVCLVASSGGLIYGYDIGISGGVSSMDSFLKKFFPSVYRQMKNDKQTSQYCKLDSALLTTFTSSLYLAAAVASFFASTVTRRYGHKISMLFGGAVFLAGAVLNGAAQNLVMLIIGRILLGIGVGFANQSVPLYLSEMAPARLRGMLNIIFQLMISIGILLANIISYLLAKIEGGWGWRIGLGGAAVPALIITVGSLFLPDTPNSLIDRGEVGLAREMLRKIRGTDDIEEYKDLVAASEESKKVEHPWRNILQLRYRPQLVMSVMIPFFQQMTGINVIIFYAPPLFNAIGFGSASSLYSTDVITGGVIFFATFGSILTVDRVGRRFLFLEGGIQMLIGQIIFAVLMGKKFGLNGEADLSKSYANAVVAFICIFVSGFAWSWGPLGWLVPSEIFPLEIRSVGQSINVSVNMFVTFAIAQVFLTMLCHLKYFFFLFSAFFVFLMTTFIFFFLPETKNVPIEEMVFVWNRHWFWRKYVSNDDISRGLEMSND